MLVPIAKVACYGLGGYTTFKATQRRTTLGQRQRWVSFWVTLVILESLEPLFDWTLFWLPFYQNAKLLVLLCLCYFQTRATTPIFRKFIHPIMSPQVRTFDHYERRVVRTVTSVHVRVTRVTSYITARLPKVKAFEVGAVEPIFEDELQPQSIESDPKPVQELNAASATDIVGGSEIKVTDIQPTTELPEEVVPDMSPPVETQADTSTESISDTATETVSKMRHSDSGIDMREPISPMTRAIGEVDKAVRRSPRVAAASRKPPVTAATTGLSASVRRSRSVMARGGDRSTVPTRATRTPLVRRATSITRLPSENTRVKTSTSPRSAKPTGPS